MKYGIVIFPGKELQDLANSFRKRYDPKYALIPPHMTLVEEFEYDNNEIASLTEKLNNVSRHFQTITLNVLKISSFQPVNNVVYLKIEPTADLTDLHTELISTLGINKPEHAFVPHITLGQNLSNDEHLDMYSSLKMRSFNHKETADRFHLLYELENGSWTVLETYRLGKDQ